MGASGSVNQTNIVQNISNNTLQSIKNTCSQVCSNKSENVVIDLVDTTNIDINFSQTCSVVGSSCVARTYLETDIQNQLSAVAEQKNTNDSNFLMFTVSSNQANLSQTIRNNVAQMVENFCQSDSNNLQDNIFIYVKDSKNAKLNFAQAGTVSNAQCMFDVTAKMSIINQESAKVDQTNLNRGIFADLIIILGLVLGIGLLFFMIFLLKGGKGGAGGASGVCDKNNQKQCQEAATKLLAKK